LSLSLLKNLLAQYAAKTDGKSPSQSLISPEETDEKKLSFAVSMVSTPNTAKKTRFHT
jgi:hypothetical protein